MDELVIFKDLPDKTTPINEENLNKNFAYLQFQNREISDAIPKNLTDLTDDMYNKADDEETAKTNSSDNPNKIYYTVEA